MVVVGKPAVLPVTINPLLLSLPEPVVTLPPAPRSTAWANWTLNVSVPVLTTAIFFVVRAPVAPPLTLSVSPNLLLILAPESPENPMGVSVGWSIDSN